LAYRPALFFVDSVRYLYNAEGMDPVGYKGPLRAILFVANFDTVAAVQHLLGLGMAVIIYLVLLRRGVPRWLAALAIAPILLDAYQLQIEQMIMPDVWFEALIVAGLAILLWQPRPGWRRVVIGGIVLGTSATVAQVGEALPSAERGMCPPKAQQAMGPDWLEYNNGSPIRPYYTHLPRVEVDSLISNFNHRVVEQQPLRLAGAYGRDVVKLFALSRNTKQGDTPISRWQFQTKYTYYPPWTSEAVVKTATARFGGGTPAVW